MTSPNISYQLIPSQIEKIVQQEQKSRGFYEELLQMQPSNTMVLRNYARLLLDIYNDEDSAEIILQRAERIEADKESTTSAGEASFNKIGMGNIDPAAQSGTSNQTKTRTSTAAKKKKNKKKKKKRGQGDDVIVAELTGGKGEGKMGEKDSSSNTSHMFTFIVLFQFLAHLIAIIGFIVAAVVYKMEASSFNVRLDNLYSVCILATVQTKQAVCAIEALHLDLDYNFVFILSKDGETETIPEWEQIRDSMLSQSKQIMDVIENIYDVTDDMGPWETNDIHTFIFGIDPKLGSGTPSGKPRQSPEVVSQDLEVTNLIRSLTLVAQLSEQIALIKMDPITLEFPPLSQKMIMTPEKADIFYPAINFVVFNTVSPILESCKKAMISYFDSTNKQTTMIVVVYVLIVALVTVSSIALSAFVFFYYIIFVKKERKEVLRLLLDMPKNKMQDTIRRIVQSEEGEGGDEVGTSEAQFEESTIDDQFGGQDEKDSNIKKECDIEGGKQLFPTLIIPSTNMNTVGDQQQRNKKDDVEEEQQENEEDNYDKNRKNRQRERTQKRYDEYQDEDKEDYDSDIGRRRRSGRDLDNDRDRRSKGRNNKDRSYRSYIDEDEEAKIREEEEKKERLEFISAESAQRGIIRHQIEDQKWEEQLDLQINKLRYAYDQLPQPILLKHIVEIIIVFAVFIASMVSGIVVLVIYVNMYSETAGGIVISGMRPPILALMQFFMLRMIISYDTLDIIKPVEFVTTNPIWNNSDHVSQNRTRLVELMQSASLYFQRLHTAIQFSSLTSGGTNDVQIDQIYSVRQDTDTNAELLLTMKDCFLTSEEACSTAQPNRIFHQSPPFFGLASLISRMRLYIWQMQEMDMQSFTVRTEEIRFISSAIRYDLSQGIDQLTVSILNLGKQQSNTSVTLIIIITVAACVLILIAFIIAAFPFARQMQRISEESNRCMDLIPQQESEKEMELLPSMRTGYPIMDNSREKIMNAGQQLFDAIRTKDAASQILSSHQALMTIVINTFEQEEKDMDSRGFGKVKKEKIESKNQKNKSKSNKKNKDEDEQSDKSEENNLNDEVDNENQLEKYKNLREAHLKDHLLIRQRLTIIGDLLRLMIQGDGQKRKQKKVKKIPTSDQNQQDKGSEQKSKSNKVVSSKKVSPVVRKQVKSSGPDLVSLGFCEKYVEWAEELGLQADEIQDYLSQDEKEKLGPKSKNQTKTKGIPRSQQKKKGKDVKSEQKQRRRQNYNDDEEEDEYSDTERDTNKKDKKKKANEEYDKQQGENKSILSSFKYQSYDDGISCVIRRSLKRLFDKHFIENDMAYAKSIPQKDKNGDTCEEIKNVVTEGLVQEADE
ncbi:MAG: hypothetical protein EZS28_008833 [Streblomastix strix]|uniref:TmcB/TmcC TPR repeats domain-containing protein n=1 Tax=Streblomastix strix TaxID=222440 RepID=A0A5J4WM55_9EUKA|nr:MAG: hypothetical protein EZS28_008833 [Streblomastix strix]